MDREGAAGKSLSRWASDLTSERHGRTWPDGFDRLRGSWPDEPRIPESEELRRWYGPDTKRETLFPPELDEVEVDLIEDSP